MKNKEVGDMTDEELEQYSNEVHTQIIALLRGTS